MNKLLVKLESRGLNLTGKLRGELQRRACGGCADVFLGSLDDGTPIAVKRARFAHDGSFVKEALTKVIFPRQIPYYLIANLTSRIKKWTREVRVWFKLEHPNILPLKGFVKEKDSICPSLVTEWMENGSLERYLKEKPDANKLLVVGSLFMQDHELFA